MEMLLRSGRRLRPQHEVVQHRGHGTASDRGLVSQPGPTDVDQRRGRPRRCSQQDHAGTGVGEDRIMALPDDLLLQVLACLGSITEAARTSILARRWSSLSWRSLDVLIFRGLDSDMLRDLLSRVRRTQVSRIEICVPRQVGGISATEVTSLLRAAQEHSPAELIFEMDGGGDGADDDLPFELPCFPRATSIELRIWKRLFTMPPAPAGQSFASLKRLTLSFCSVNPDVFLPYCPHLCILDMCCYWMLDTITISSGSLKEILLRVVPVPVVDVTPQHVNVQATKLNKFRLQSSGNRDMITSFKAPTVDSLLFSYFSKLSRFVGFGYLHLLNLSTSMEWTRKYTELNNPSGVRLHLLSMVILASGYGRSAEARRSFTEEIIRLPVNNFSVFMLHVRMEDRYALSYGTLVLDLLKTLNVIQMLQLFLPQERGTISTKKEYAHYMDDIKSNRHISLTNLEVVEIKGLNVTDHDLGFLNILLKSAPMLKIVRIELSKGVRQSDTGYIELCYICSVNDSVKCFVNGRLENKENLQHSSPRLSNQL